MCLAGSCPWLVRVLGWCGYLHALNLVSLVRVSLVGSDYLHTLNLVSLVGVLVRAGWKWLPACLETRVPGLCVPGWFLLYIFYKKNTLIL